jgi:hypothetical protein
MHASLRAPLPDGPFGAAFRGAACATLEDAFRLVHRLPYGRNARPEAPLAVLDEGRGTCSTKHALLARLAREAGAPVGLRLGLFLMSEANTPGVGGALAAAGLACVPEAHCFLVVGGERIDLTFASGGGGCALDFLEEREVDPAALFAIKVPWHRRELARWAEARGLDPERVWAAREACIGALSRAGGAP